MTTASALALAFVVYSCKSNLSEAAKLDLSVTPLQTVDSMFFVQTENGRLKMRVESPRMEVYEHDTLSYDLFPAGIHVYAYAEDGALETTIVARKARHDKFPRRKDDELWSVFGDVVVRNILRKQTMETDTLYWDSKTHEIWTDCYIKLSSPDGFMQGIGMRSDDMARNAILMHPFDNEFLMNQDSTKVVIDTVNFIGPLLKKL
ncbi:MAG: LPS export ABC transporter periplasmic protein LptC [Bacteroidales bacterium]|jgi:LPS export ABC transporter protein LptC|nr:LPS export ABC transporter periplasmic protein LptC [Bacteroidales bacterium]